MTPFIGKALKGAAAIGALAACLIAGPAKADTIVETPRGPIVEVNRPPVEVVVGNGFAVGPRFDLGPRFAPVGWYGGRYYGHGPVYHGGWGFRGGYGGFHGGERFHGGGYGFRGGFGRGHGGRW